MSFTFIVLMMLLGSSMVIAFVLPPSKEEPEASADSPVSHHRCQGGSWQSIRKGLLGALNLQVEPRLPAGGLDAVREQWRSTFSTLAHRAKDTAVAADVPSPDVGNGPGPECCSMASEIFMKDLGWDSWVIHPASLSIVQCALCNPDVNTVHPSSHGSVQDTDSQVPCCQPTSQELVQILYMDEDGTVVISSMELTRSCGCVHPSTEESNLRSSPAQLPAPET